MKCIDEMRTEKREKYVRYTPENEAIVKLLCRRIWIQY